ncbi:MAG: hypothetical protein H0W55_06210 [Actinobacteria bacterium]|nr:hypothetical protein [Actinomycetota bacterium]MDQ3533364.1 hypothetical protein [Actinomycetota bacterium]
MKIYADTPRLRTRQIMLDAIFIGWILLWIRLGVLLSSLVTKLSVPLRAVREPASDLARGLSDVSEAVLRLPVVGDELSGSFKSAAGAGRSLAAAGARQGDSVDQLAILLGVMLAGLAIAYALGRYLPERLAWIREATAAGRIQVERNDLYLFALRALVNRPLHELRRAAPDPAGAFAAGRYDALAALELEALGLRAGPTGQASSG